MKQFIPESVIELTPDMQFRAQLKTTEGTEVLDCRLWFRDPSGIWNPDSNAVAIECHSLLELQQKRQELMEKSKRKFDQALADIQTEFQRAIAQAQEQTDLATEQAHQESKRTMQEAQLIGDRAIQEYNTIANIVLLTAESLISQLAGGS